MIVLHMIFCPMSMFSISSNGSKIALIALMGVLALNKFLLLDVQFITNHLKTMGAKEVSRNLFLDLLQKSTSQRVQLLKPDTLAIDKTLIKNAEKKLLVGISELKH